MIWAVIISFLAGIASVHIWEAIKWLSARGITPNGPTLSRKIALARGWNGIGPIPEELLGPLELPKPPAVPDFAACQEIEKRFVHRNSRPTTNPPPPRL